MACVFAVVAPALPMDEAERAAARAVELLRQAVAKGYKGVAEIKRASDLNPLRSRPDFQTLLAELEAGTKPQ